MSAEDLGFVSDRLARIPAFIQANYLDNGKLPFASVLVGRGDDIALQWSSGVAEDAIFRIASMTKPITSVAFMQLVERGLVALTDPVTKYIPEFAQLGVFVGGGGNVPFMTRAPKTQMRVIDLLRHTAGFTYSFQEQGNIDAAYRKTDVESWTKNTSQSVIDTLAQIPLEFDPGTQWNYSVATDILGILVERISGLSLPEYFQTHIFTPLGMTDTFFQVPSDKAARIPEGFAFDPEAKMKLIDKAGADSMWAKGWSFNSGGGGLASSVADYYRFCRMLLNGGALEGARILSPTTVRLMASDHLANISTAVNPGNLLLGTPGYTFGLGFLVRNADGNAGVHGSAGEFTWAGYAGTYFWAEPKEQICGVYMTQAPSPLRASYRRLMKGLVAQAITE